MNLSVIIPVFNEESGICEVLEGLARLLGESGLESEIIVINDGSSDASREMAENSPRQVRLIDHPENMGYGAAVKTGVQVARYEWVLLIDGDGSYPVTAIPGLISKALELDSSMVVGLPPRRKMPFLRRPASRILNGMASYLAGKNVLDVNSGLRLIKKRALQNYMNLLADDHSFNLIATLAFVTHGHSVSYVDIDFNPGQKKRPFRPLGSLSNFLKMLLTVILLFEPLKSFLPAGLFFLILSLAVYLYQLLLGYVWSVTAVLLFVTGIQLIAIGMLAALIDKRLH